MADPAAPIAISILAVLALALVGWLVVARRETPYTWSLFGLHLANRFVTRILWRGDVVGRIDLPASQGAVIVSNHISGIDPLLIQLSVLRVVHWMVAKEYYSMPGVSMVFRHLKSIPVNRGGVDTAATKTAIRYARQGGLVGLFPEGRINTTDEFLLPGRPGVALIALRARVPVVPVYVEGSPYNGVPLESFFMTAKARVTVGAPIDLSPYFSRDNDRAVQQELTMLFLKEIAKLAGREDFEPRLAGRNWKPGQEDQKGNGNGEAVAARASNRHSDK